MARRRRRNAPIIPITIQTDRPRGRRRDSYGGGGSSLGLLAVYAVGAYLLYGWYQQQQGGGYGTSPPTTSQGILPGTKYIQGVGQPGPNQTYWVNDAGYVVLSDGPPNLAGNWSPASGADLTAAGLLGAPAG